MISNPYDGSVWLHFLLKQFIGLLLFWGTVWLLHLAVYGEELLPVNYSGFSVLVPAAALFELLVRERLLRCLAGLSRCQLWVLTQREILFVLMAIFGVIVMMKDERYSRVFLAIFFTAYAFWIAWMNLVGHRLLHRVFHRRAVATSR